MHTPAVHAPSVGGGGPWPMCGQTNPPDVRYCMSCGTNLVQPPAGAPAAFAPAPAAPAAYTPAPPVAQAPYVAAPAPIAPARVVEISAPATPRDVSRVCGRCHGTNDGASAFCKFCGAPLADAPAVERAPASNRAPFGASPAPPQVSPNPIAPAGMIAPTPAPPLVAPVPAAAPIGPIAAQAGLAPEPVRQPSARPPPVAPVAPVAPGPVNGSHGSARPPAPHAVSAGAAASPGKGGGKLVVVARDGQRGPEYPIGDVVDVGRSDAQVAVPEDRFLSPRHCRLVWRDRRLFLVDLGSTNGVYLRLCAKRSGGVGGLGAGETGVVLENQDLILVGQQVLRFDLLKDAEASQGPAWQHGTMVFGTPAAPRYARLCQRGVEGVTFDVFYLRKAETVLGRESGDIVFGEDPFLSRRHAAIRVDGVRADESSPARPVRCTLVDLGSSNGTFVQIRGEAEVFEGDQFRVGQQLFRVEATGLPVASAT